ncbi:Vps23 core domain-containing protein [Chytriomyces sp. MP71]|nr:Vps23 core domain-containing protein [Chytriomyces sp. MP71]
MRANGVVVLEGEARVRSVLAALQAEEVKVKRNAEVLAAKGVEMHGVMERLAAQGEVDVDEILGAGSVVQNQLLEVIAEEHALDDSIYYLGKALNAEKVELAAFMKHTRVLARELFFKRALLKKIQLLIQMNT